MASGTIKGTFTNLSASHLYPEIRWRSTKNDTKNNSSVTAELWFVRVNTAYISNNAYFLPRITINGNAAYPPDGTYAPFDVRKGTHKVWQRTVTVAHNADGNKSITIAAGGITGLSNLGNVRVSGTAKLDTIPRASSISSISGNQIGGNITVNISRASNSFTHRVGYYDTDGKRRNEIQDATTSTTFSIPLDRCNLLPNSTSGVAKIVVDTYSGSTKIGSVSKTHTVYVPSSVVPTVNSFNIAEGITKVANVKLPANNFVQNMSRLDMTAGASGKYNSTIKDYTFSFNGQSQGGMSGRQFNAGNANGTYTAKVEVTDSRGRKASKSVSVTVHKYNSPSINNFKIYRVDQTTQVKADINFTITNINSLGGSWSIQKLVGTTWTNTNTGTLTTTHSATGLVVAGTYDVTKSQNFRVVLSDAFGTGATATASISTAKTLMDFNRDEGIGIGKMHERGALDVGGQTYISGKTYPHGGIHFGGKSGLTVEGGGGFYNGILPAGDMSSGAYWHQTIFPMGISHWHKNKDDPLTNPPGGINGWGMMQVMKNQNGAGEFTVIYYTQANGRIFRTGGNSSSTNLTWYEVHSGATPGIHTNYTPPELYSGAIFMDKGQKVYPTKKLSQCRNGWALYWSDYTWETGTTNNWDWNITYIHKSALTAKGFNGFHSVVGQANSKPAIVKYMYLRDDHLEGNAHNTSRPDLKNVVLRKVYEF